VNVAQVFVAVFLASLLGFGGLGSLPVLRGQLAGSGLPTDQLLLSSLAVGNISPGPNGLYLIAVGYFVDGYFGAAAATLAVLLPPMLVLLLDKVRARLIHLPRFRSTLQSLALAVVALLAVSSGQLAFAAAHTWLGAVMAAIGLALLMVRVPPLVGVLIAAATGLVLNALG
jgi:chromate transporter